VAVLFLLATAQSALAYIDPNTGGMLFQLLAVIFASLSAILLLFSRQIRMLVARLKRGVRSLFRSIPEPGPPATMERGALAESIEDQE
jgi:hypothetical protein